jgi:hypothetical protein
MGARLLNLSPRPVPVCIDDPVREGIARQDLEQSLRVGGPDHSNCRDIATFLGHGVDIAADPQLLQLGVHHVADRCRLSSGLKTFPTAVSGKASTTCTSWGAAAGSETWSAAWRSNSSALTTASGRNCTKATGTSPHVPSVSPTPQSDDECFFLRIYGPGELRWKGADLGVIVTKGRLQAQTDDAGAYHLGIRARHLVKSMLAGYRTRPLAPGQADPAQRLTGVK